MAQGSGIAFRIVVHDEEVLAGLRAQRRMVRQDIKTTTLAAANAVTVPRLRSIGVPSRMRSTFMARSNTSGARLTTSARRMDRRIIGLLNFGGDVATPLFPKNARALALRGGFVRASVRGTRHYRGKRFMEQAAEETLPRYCEHVERNLARIMQSRITHAGAFG